MPGAGCRWGRKETDTWALGSTQMDSSACLWEPDPSAPWSLMFLCCLDPLLTLPSAPCHPDFSRAVQRAHLYLSSLHPSVQLAQKNIFPKPVSPACELLSEHLNKAKAVTEPDSFA